MHYGQGQWNGVAILSRVGIADVSNGFGDAHVDPYDGDARVIAATCGGIRVVSVYVPNGREVATDFYERKLHWLGSLYDWIDASTRATTRSSSCGDFNVAPEDRDVWDPKKFVGATHVTDPERKAVARLEEWGLDDAFRARVPRPRPACSATGTTAPATSTSTAACASTSCSRPQPVIERVTWAVVDRNARKGTGPSDHAPVIIDLHD